MTFEDISREYLACTGDPLTRESLVKYTAAIEAYLESPDYRAFLLPARGKNAGLCWWAASKGTGCNVYHLWQALYLAKVPVVVGWCEGHHHPHGPTPERRKMAKGLVNYLNIILAESEQGWDGEGK